MKKYLLPPLAALLTLIAQPAAADPCNDLWFTRNLIMDRAGYCFGSALGKSTFDNAGCKGKSVTLSRSDQKLVDQLRRAEKVLECKVKTSATRLTFGDKKWRWMMRDLPVATGFESGCFGWLDPATPLYVSRDRNAPVASTIQRGDNLLYAHEGTGGWEYVLILRNDAVVGAGWLGYKTNEKSCEGWAG